MRASGLLLLSLFGSVTSSPAPPSAPSPPSLLSPPSSPASSPPSSSTEGAHCLLVSPSTLVVRFGDPAAANCSVSRSGFSGLGWEVSPPLQEAPQLTMEASLVWRVERMTEWSIQLMCYALSEQGGQCHSALPLTVYKPPDNVSISFTGHSGPLTEGQQYSLQCEVQEVAPVQSLLVTFYRGHTPLAQPQTRNSSEKKPVSERFTLSVTPSKQDHGVQYWCEAKLQLGPEGPQRPPVVTSQSITAAVLFGPQLVCPPKLQVREGEMLSCEVTGNPKPSVTWFRDGQAVVLPVRSSAKHAGKYTACTKGLQGQKNFTVEVEVLSGSGATNSCENHFLLAVLLGQMLFCL